ncbi:hypothetical protein BGZ97_007724, partial [Linnemannia gamsii]
MKKKETMGATVDIQIRVELSAAENFLHLNKLTSNSHSIVPFTSSPPGYLINYFVCDVAPQGLTSRQRKKAAHRAAVRLLSLSEIGAHLDDVKDGNLNPLEYELNRYKRGYVLRGSIRTDGFRVQLVAFKLRELQVVRYRRRTNYYLQEIRNVVTSKEDIERYWSRKNIEDIMTLGLDGGRARIYGTFAHLPAE